MPKTSVFLLILILLGFTIPSKAQFLSYEDYAHLSNEKQEDFIIKIMELVTEIETNYIHDTNKYGFNQNRFEKFNKKIEQISKIFGLPAAYADDVFDASNWAVIQKHLSEAQTNKNLCFYAGWISQTYRNKEGNLRCMHPARVENFKSGYPRKTGIISTLFQECPHQSQVHCNPLIFGYKNIKSRSLFCVDTTDGAQNSSYQCMKEALNGPNKKERLDYLRSKLSDPKAYEAARGFIYKSCLCSNNYNLDKDFQDSVRPRLTCYSLIEMMRNVSYEGCLSPKIFQNESIDIFESLHSHMKKFQDTTDQVLLEREYKSYISDKLSSPALKKELRAVCEGIKESYKCEKASCKVRNKDGKKVTTSCSLKVKKIEGKNESDNSIRSSGRLPLPDKQEPFEFVEKISGEEVKLTCPNVSFEAEKENISDKTKTPSPESKDKTPSVKSKNKTPASEPKTKLPAPESKDKAPAPSTTPEAPAQLLPRSPTSPTTPASPSLILEPVVPGPAPESKDKTPVPSTTPDAPAPAAPAPNDPAPAAPAPDEPADPKEEALKPVLSLTKKDDKATVTVKAELKNADGWTLSWLIKDTDQKVEKSWERKKSSTEIESVLPKDDSLTDVPKDQAPTLEFTQPRYSFKYSVCGKLTKENESPIQECLEIPPIENQKPMVHGPLLAPRGMMPQTPIRQSSDTSAMGIK